MAFDCFLKLDGIPGESTDAKFSDQIEVLSYHHGMSQTTSGSVSSGGGRTAGRCDHQDFTIVKTLDKASPKLALFCCNGNHIANAVMTLCRSGGDKMTYMVYKMTDLIVSSYSPSGSAGGGDPLPLESVSFAYGTIEWTYTETDHKTGKTKGNVDAKWDLLSNKGA